MQETMQAKKRRPIVSEGYWSGAAARVVGMNVRTLQRWTDRGMIQPSLGKTQGRGHRDLFSFNDLVAIKTAVRLRERGISLQSIQKALAFLRQYDSAANLANTYLVSDGKDIYEKSRGQMRSLLRRPGQMAFVWEIDLGEIQQEVRQALREAA